MKDRNYLLMDLGIGLIVIGGGGCAAIYCAKAYGEQPFYFAGRQMIWLGIGTILFFLTARIPFAKLKQIAFPTAFLSLVILILTAFFGVKVNNMSGWLPIPFTGIRIQPSELFKPVYLLALCLAVQNKRKELFRFLSGLAVTAGFCIQLLIQPDFGTATIYAILFPVVLYCAGFRKRYTLPVLFGWIPAGILFVLRYPYASRRISAFLNPEADLYGAGWHIHQFRYTMASGGLTGANETGALWANTYLPYAHSDSVFSALVEASGFIGGCIVLLGFCVMILLFRKAATETNSPDKRLFLFCCGVMLTLQAFLHIGVNVTMIPPTGLPLPFFSYGGSNLAGVMLLLGAACSAYQSRESELDSQTVQEDKENCNRSEVPDQNRP